MRNESKQLGMNYSTANNQLKKKIMFSLLKKLKENYCYRCKLEIEDEKELSVEHKRYWLHVNNDLFWDLDNIAFSHNICNIKSSRNNGKVTHGLPVRYQRYGCRCDECREANTIAKREYRKRVKQRQ